MAISARFITLLSFTSGCVLAAASAAAFAEQPDAAWADEIDELLQWHSGVSDEGNICIAPQRESAFSRLPMPETTPLLAWHGAPGAAGADPRPLSFR